MHAANRRATIKVPRYGAAAEKGQSIFGVSGADLLENIVAGKWRVMNDGWIIEEVQQFGDGRPWWD